MTTATYLSFYPQIAAHVPGVPTPVAISFIRKIVIDLCDRARVWRQQIDPVVLSSPVSITGDIQIIAQVALANWVPATPQDIISSWQPLGNQLSYRLFVDAAGKLNLQTSPDGVTVRSSPSSVATGAGAGVALWIKATKSMKTGAVNYYTAPASSVMPTTWTPLGTQIASTVESIFGSTADLELGADSGGAAQLLIGELYQAYVYNGIGGTQVVGFQGSDGQAGVGVLASTLTGEIYTLNGTVVIAGANPSQYLNFDGSAGAYATTPDTLPVGVYPLVAIDQINTDIESIESATLTPSTTGQAVPLDTEVEAVVKRLNPNWPDYVNVGQPQRLFQREPNYFRVDPLPDTNQFYTVNLLAILRPTVASTGCEATLLTNYSRAIFHGTLHELYNMPGRAWSDEKKALFHGKMWENMVKKAKAKANKNFGTYQYQVKQRPWA